MITSIWLKLLPYILGAALILGGAFGCYHYGVKVTSEHYELLISKSNLEHSNEVIALQNKVRLEEQNHAEKINAISIEYEGKMNDEKSKLTAIIDSYASGAVRLRNKFTCQSSAPNSLPVTTTTASVDHGKTSIGLQRQDVEFLVSEAARADSTSDQLRSCQAVILSDRTK